MAIDFPASPSVDDTFTSGGVTYTWDGTVWAASGSAAFAAKTGDTFTGDVTINAALSIDGPVEQAAEAVAALNIDCSLGNYFTKAVSADSTFTFSNVPATGKAYSFTLELDITGDRTITWPTEVKFNGDTAPTLTADKTHLFMFVTDNGGTRWRASALVDYVD